MPLDPRLREQRDLAVPLVEADPESETSREIVRIAESVLGLERERGIGLDQAAARRLLTAGAFFDLDRTLPAPLECPRAGRRLPRGTG